MTAPSDLIQSHVWRGVARRLGQWHAVLPIVSMSSSPAESIPACRLDVDAKKVAPVATTGDITSIQPREAGPNLWTVLQKWILALPAATEEQRSRQRGLQKELQRIIGELDDGAGIGKGGVGLGPQKICGVLTRGIAGLCTLRPAKRQCDRRSSAQYKRRWWQRCQ